MELLRSRRHISETVEVLDSLNKDSVVTVVSTPMWWVENEFLAVLNNAEPFLIP